MGSVNDNQSARPAAGRSTYERGRGLLGKLESLLLALGAFAIIGFCAYITLGIILRTFFASQIPDEVVIVGELMVAALVLPLAYVAADKGFIAVEILTSRFGKRAQSWLNMLAATVGLVAAVPITYAAYLAAHEALESGNYFFGILELPEWPGRLVFFIGYTVLMLRLVDLCIHELLVGLGIVKNHQPPLPLDNT